MTGKLPYGEQSDALVTDAMTQERPPADLDTHNRHLKPFKSMLKECWKRSPDERCTMSECRDMLLEASFAASVRWRAGEKPTHYRTVTKELDMVHMPDLKTFDLRFQTVSENFYSG